MNAIDLYQVKFKTPDGVLHYGIVDSFPSKKPPKGHLLVEDAIVPRSYHVPKDAIVALPFDFDGEYYKFVKAEEDKANKVSEACKGKLMVGAMFSCGVADGSASYVVTKVGKTKVSIEWRGFCLDRYVHDVFGWGGSFPRNIIASKVAQQGAMARIFGGA